MSITLRYVDTGANQKLLNLKKVPRAVIKQGYEVFRDETPVKSGAARRATTLNQGKMEIQANYAYAQRLDTGWSSQAPEGMSKAAMQAMIEEFEKQCKDAGV